MTKRNEHKGGDERLNPASFSLSDFKKWMESQQNQEAPKPNLVGTTVESKVSVRKLVARMESEDDLEELARDFKKNGGIIAEVDGHRLMIECDSGTFTIHRTYVKRCD